MPAETASWNHPRPALASCRAVWGHGRLRPLARVTSNVSSALHAHDREPGPPNVHQRTRTGGNDRLIGGTLVDEAADPRNGAGVHRVALRGHVAVGCGVVDLDAVTIPVARAHRRPSGDIVATKRLDEVAHVWNLTQAVLRKASSDMEKCLLVLGLVLAVAVPLLAADIALLRASGARLLPGLLVSCGITYALLVAAMVSERCARVPAFVNAISFGPGTERMRQHTVDYITSSAAGFYVCDTRLTTSMVTKMIYIWCIVVAGGLTRLVAV